MLTLRHIETIEKGPWSVTAQVPTWPRCLCWHQCNSPCPWPPKWRTPGIALGMEPWPAKGRRMRGKFKRLGWFGWDSPMNIYELGSFNGFAHWFTLIHILIHWVRDLHADVVFGVSWLGMTTAHRPCFDHGAAAKLVITEFKAGKHGNGWACHWMISRKAGEWTMKTTVLWVNHVTVNGPIIWSFSPATCGEGQTPSKDNEEPAGMFCDNIGVFTKIS